MITVKPVNIGIGGPLAALVSGMSGYSQALPWWSLFPLACVVGAPLTVLFPVILPLYMLTVISRRYRERWGAHAAFEERLRAMAAAEAQAAAVTDSAARELSGAAQAAAEAGRQIKDDKKTELGPIEGIGEAEVKKAGDRQAQIDAEIEQERLRREHQHELVSSALARFNLSAFIKNHMLMLSLILTVYYTVLSGAFIWAGWSISEAMNRYTALASKNKVLQIATPEQLAYSDTVINIVTIAGIIIFTAMLVSFTLVAVRAVKDLLVIRLNDSSSEGSQSISFNVNSDSQVLLSGSMLSLTMSVIIRNLPGIAVLSAIFYSAFIVIERYYAHLRISAIDAMVLGRDYFDPSLLFIFLRLYAVQAFTVSLMLVILMSLHAIALNFQHRFSRI